MQRMLAVARTIDAVNAWIGRHAAWLIVASILISAANAIIRKLFNSSSNGWLEVQWYLFGATFMLCASWTLQRREHIRIDLLFARLPRRVRHWLELGGHVLFLMPFVLLMIVLCWAALGRSVINGAGWTEAPGFFGELGLVASRLAGDIGMLLTGRDARWEYSNNPGGLPLWPAYACILAGFLMLAAQGLSEIIKHIAVMRGLLPEPSGGGGHGAEASDHGAAA
jgi:TRAP-type mannitol/chloroaromatic compound transport system permease small subunit